MKIIIIIIYLFSACKIFAQQSGAEDETEIYSTQLEDLSQDVESESENDDELQQLRYFRKHPLDINGSNLEQLGLLNAILISNLSSYRNILGDLIDIHELQAVPGFNIEIIKAILPFVSVKKDKPSFTNLHKRLTGEHTFLIRPSITPELSEGFSAKKFLGSRPALFLRYKYQYRNLLQYGLTMDKDAGEKLFVNGPFPDFISYHMFARRIGMISHLAIGDYTINLGQGLIHWQSQAFRKSSSVINIKRQSEVLRPYHSAGEYNFHRGIATTISKGRWQATLFFSKRNLTANIDSNVITSVITSGLHRTQTEIDDRKSINLFTSGGRIQTSIKTGHIGINSVHYIYSLAVSKQDEPYNLYAIKGRRWNNISSDYSYTFRNFHLFGEVATDKNLSVAYINGVIASLSPSVELAMLFRKISQSYQSIFGNAFTENTMPWNERGFYTGVALKPHSQWKVDLYADLFSFPWLKYRLDAPASGFSYLVQITYKPSKHTEVYSRFRYRLKPLNIENEERDLKIPGFQAIQNWRTQFSHQITRTFLLRSRVELCIFYHEYLPFPRSGYLFFTDIIYKPYSSIISGNLRVQAFEAYNYDTRIYAYENDLLFVSSTPSYYNNGVRYYLNIKAKLRVKILINKQLTINFKAASTVYKNISYVGSGPTSIPGNRVSSVKLQIFLSE